MTTVRFLIFASILAVVGTLPALTFSKPADSKKTKKPCLFCHVKYGVKELTKAGKYYKDKGTLDGFEEAAGEESFGKRQAVLWVWLPHTGVANPWANTANLRTRIAQKDSFEAKGPSLEEKRSFRPSRFQVGLRR